MYADELIWGWRSGQVAAAAAAIVGVVILLNGNKSQPMLRKEKEHLARYVRAEQREEKKDQRPKAVSKPPAIVIEHDEPASGCCGDDGSCTNTAERVDAEPQLCCTSPGDSCGCHGDANAPAVKLKVMKRSLILECTGALQRSVESC